MKVIAQNKRARHRCEILETLEAGLVLQGSEVKSLREGKASLSESHVSIDGGEAWLLNASVEAYSSANRFNHSPRRRRKLLLRRREIRRLVGSVERKGYALLALSLYFDEKGRVKASLGLGKWKTLADKRATLKRKEWDRDKRRLLKVRSR